MNPIPSHTNIQLWQLTLTVYPGSLLLIAPGIKAVGDGVVLPPLVTLTWAQLM
jgi:hypothetical protein